MLRAENSQLRQQQQQVQHSRRGTQLQKQTDISLAHSTSKQTQTEDRYNFSETQTEQSPCKDQIRHIPQPQQSESKQSESKQSESKHSESKQSESKQSESQLLGHAVYPADMGDPISNFADAIADLDDDTPDFLGVSDFAPNFFEDVAGLGPILDSAAKACDLSNGSYSGNIFLG